MIGPATGICATMIKSLLLLILVAVAPTRLWKMLVIAIGELMTLGSMNDRPDDWMILLALVGVVATAIYTVQGKGQQAKR